MSNHLGNVLVTISDKKIGVDVAPQDGIIDYYNADVVTANDYYPFGSQMPGRKYSQPNSSYRYGFNGKENDKDISEGGQDYGMRIYDSRLGKFLSVDPLTSSYPWYTPYQFAGNTPVQAVDLDGAEEYHYLRLKDNEGRTILVLLDVKDIVREVVTKRKLGRGGNLPVETKTVVNQEQLYVVHQLSEYVYKGANNTKFTHTYEESVVFKTKAEAEGVTDQAFAGTADDYWGIIGSGLAIATGDIDESEWSETDYTGFQQTNSKKAGGTVVRKVFKQLQKIYEKHHITPKSLRNIPFVKKAIQGGFKLNGLKNLTPLEKFFKHVGRGIHAKHPKYTAQIKSFLENLNTGKFTPVQASEMLHKVNEYILKRIKDSKGVKLNDIDLKLDKIKF